MTKSKSDKPQVKGDETSSHNQFWVNGVLVAGASNQEEAVKIYEEANNVTD